MKVYIFKFQVNHLKKKRITGKIYINICYKYKNITIIKFFNFTNKFFNKYPS